MRPKLIIELPDHVIKALALLPKDQSGPPFERAARALVTLARHAAHGVAHADSWERMMLESAFGHDVDLRSLLRKLAFQFGSNSHTARSLNIILDALRRVDRRRAKRLVEAVAAFIPYATRTPKDEKRARKP